MNKLTETSIISPTNAVVIGLAVALFAGSLVMTIYGWVKWQVIRPVDLLVAAVFALVLVQRAAAKYRYELDNKVLRITKSYIGYATEYDIPVRNMSGVYRKAAKATRGNFRRSHRLHSALDGRPIWTIAYSQQDRVENRRVYFKPSEAMLTALAELLPGKVKESEEDLGGRRPAKRK
ncbi:MAG: hypothetical protein P4N41_06720 [Negativicutes bacterium]|nr:hypothetical protein [Negativicutes bacterium]